MEYSPNGHRPLAAGSRLPLLIENDRANCDIVEYAGGRKQQIIDLLLRHGAILFRGFNVDQSTFCEFVDSLSGGRLDYTYRSTPRTRVANKLFTTTVYRADREIPLHCENAYQRDWPMLLAFYCVQPALKGGETPLADVSRVTERIGPQLLEQFRRRGVCYIRNYAAGIDLPWTEVFQTESRTEVEQFCAAHDIKFAWGQGNSLRTMQVCQGTAIHPKRGVELWFNQAHLFHISSLGHEIAQDMIDAFGLEGLPRNAVYGDGQAIASRDLELIRNAFENEAITFDWRERDVLLVDNMQVAHGRRSYVGPRKVLIAMSDPCSANLRNSRGPALQKGSMNA